MSFAKALRSGIDLLFENSKRLIDEILIVEKGKSHLLLARLSILMWEETP